MGPNKEYGKEFLAKGLRLLSSLSRGGWRRIKDLAAPRTARADLAGDWQTWEPDGRVLRSEWAVGKWGQCVQQLLTEVCLEQDGDTAGNRR